MSDSDDDLRHDDNVFLNLVRRCPVQLGLARYEPRVCKTLGTILRNATPEEFDTFIADFIYFAQTAHHARPDPHLYVEFINVCANAILNGVFARRASTSTDMVRKLMERTSVYLQDQTDNLAIAWRRFTPLHSPGQAAAAASPLMLVAQSRQADALKLLLQCGMLERERQPANVVAAILFSPPCLGGPGGRGHTGGRGRAAALGECLALCCRVLTHVPVADIEMLAARWRWPVSGGWRRHIPEARTLGPSELSHLCRAALRNRLLTGGRRLPDDIRALPLPPRLRDYLNLER